MLGSARNVEESSGPAKSRWNVENPSMPDAVMHQNFKLKTLMTIRDNCRSEVVHLLLAFTF